MKKIVVLLALFISTYVFAQDFKIGLTLAPTINFNKHELKIDEKWKISDEGSGGLGWKGGLLADYRFAGNYYIHSGLLIHSKSFNTDAADTKVTTLEVPLALKLRSSEVADNVHITGFFGATLDFNVAAKSEGYDVMDSYNPIGTSFMAGAGAEYDLDFGSVGLGLSYHLGFTDVAKSDIVRVKPKHLSIDIVFYF
jgi:hypothetical protein